jgi:DNA-binding beta-propeller fold protein YncE
MNQLTRLFTCLSLLGFSFQGCKAQPSVQSKALPFSGSIAMQGVSGRIDHLAFDPHMQRIFVAALGNHTIEVVDLKSGKVTNSIKGLSEPQGLAYISVNHSLFVANGGNGECGVYNGYNFEKTASIQLSGDADNVRYDSVHQRIYVGYGEGGIAIIDAGTFKQLNDIKLEGHPESFQLDMTADKLYVNVPDKQEVDVIDLAKQQVTDRWKLSEAKSNYPMSLDAENHRLFIGCRHPAKLLVLDTKTGKLISSINTDSDADDVFYHQKNKSIYLSCGEGHVDIIKQSGPDSYIIAEKVPTRSGARTSLLIREMNLLIVAAPKTMSSGSSLLLYTIIKQ